MYAACVPSWNSLWDVWVGWSGMRNGWDLCVRRIKFPFLSDGNPFVFFHHSNRLYHIIPSSSHHRPRQAIHFHFAYTCAYTLVVVHPILLSIIFPTWSEEGSLFIHVLMLRIEVFRVLLEPRQNDFFRRNFLYLRREFVYIYFHLRSSCNICFCYFSFNVIRFNLPWWKLFQWLSLIWRKRISKNKSWLGNSHSRLQKSSFEPSRHIKVKQTNLKVLNILNFWASQARFLSMFTHDETFAHHLTHEMSFHQLDF